MNAEREDPMICFCNEVRLGAVVRAMDEGATTLAELFDRTWAGCGACGGTCQPDLLALLRDFYGLPEADNAPAEGGG